MATYKKVSEHDLNTNPNDDDLIPSIITNPDGTTYNANIPYSALKGPAGNDGLGVPTGGTTNQVLSKASNTNNDTQWSTLSKSSVGLGNVDNTSDLNKPVSTAVQAAINSAVSTAIAQAKQDQYPVGSIYFNASNSTNPGSLLGFGTWVAWGAGRVPVGFDSTQTEFDTVEETGGSKTNSILQTHLPNVQGAMNLHGGENGSIFAGAGGVFGARADIRSGYKTLGPTGGSQSLYYNVTFDLNAGTYTPLPNLQPYITVYMWKRTA